MTDRQLDLSDPMVRAMAERDHQPAEMWTVAGSLLSVHCETCKQSWRCATRRALDALCTCPVVDISSSRLGEMPGTSFAKGLDPKCPQHGPNG